MSPEPLMKMKPVPKINMWGIKIKRERKKQGFTLDELSKSCGVSKSTLSEIENANVSPSICNLEKILSALGYVISVIPSVGFGFNLSTKEQSND